jgi:molybdopterin converting factor small subunit
VAEVANPEPTRAALTVRYFAAAAEAAGREEETIEANLAASLTTVGAVRAHLIHRHGAAMASVLANGSFLVDGVVSRDDARAVGARIDVLPPFAGG